MSLQLLKWTLSARIVDEEDRAVAHVMKHNAAIHLPQDRISILVIDDLLLLFMSLPHNSHKVEKESSNDIEK